MRKMKKSVKKRDIKVISGSADKLKDARASKNPVFISLLVAFVIILLAAEIFFALKKQEISNKKPLFVSQWSPTYKGHVGWPVCNDHLYIVDNNVNQVKKYMKMDGKPLEVYEIDGVPKWAAETKTGDTLIAVNNSNILLKYSGIKQSGKIELKEIKNIGNMAVNSRDELYVTDTGKNEVAKYSLDGVLLKKMGGTGSGAKLQNIGRLFMDGKDWLYVYDNSGKMRIVIYDNKDNFVRAFKLKAPVMMDLEAMAITNDGNIYINDFSSGMIYTYSSRGELLNQWNTDKESKYKIGLPGALGGGMDDYIFVGSQSLAIFQPVK